jgi:predicted transcriptional regulator
MIKTYQRLKMKLDKKIKVKKQKVIGKQEYINADTGEVKEFDVIEKVVKDTNFHKVWLMDLLAVLDLIGTQKLKVLEFLFSEMRTQDNTVSVTYRYIADKTGISYQTVAITMKMLIDANLITKVRTGTYRFNPDIIIKGDSKKREGMVIKYIQEREENEPTTTQTNSKDC